MDYSEIVLNTLVLTGEPMKAGDIAEKAGIEKKDAEKAIKNLVQAGKIESPRRCFYSPKK
jgi:predicted transcriptional regulator